jgi:chitinase
MISCAASRGASSHVVEPTLDIMRPLTRWLGTLACVSVAGCATTAGGPARTAGHAPAPGHKVVIAYVFVGDRAIDPKSIPAEKLTHINYAFANIANGRMAEGFAHDAENYAALTSLRQRNPKLKVLVSVGGWTWSGGFSDVALTAASRRVFAESAVAFVKKYDLDGLDVDWEFPGQKGLDNVHRPEDRENYTALLADLRAALDVAGRADGRHYALTSATQAADEWLAHTEMGKVQASLDYVNLMAYDMFEESSDTITGHHAPLFTNPANPKRSSAATMIEHYVAAGVPAAKLVLGVPFYGHAWGHVPATEHGLYQPGRRPDTRIRASYGAITDSLENKNGFVRYWDDLSAAPFLYNADRRIFISYEDPQSIRAKGRYVTDHGLAGMMFWELGGDPRGELLDAMAVSEE